MTAAYHAFIDEAGDRGHSARSTDHFVMSAVVMADTHLPAASALLAKLRQDLKRRPGDPLHWQNLRTHSHRLHAAKTLGGFAGAHIASVVVCKRDLAAKRVPDEDVAYFYTFRFLLERLSWFARDHGSVLDYTLAAIVRFKTATLRHYEQRLRAEPGCNVAWHHLDAHGGRIDQPNRVELLQLADIAASATFKAFDPDEFGNTEVRYLTELAPRLYRRPPGPLTSYGLKMHPWTDAVTARYPWIAELS